MRKTKTPKATQKEHVSKERQEYLQEKARWEVR
jgi:hypothetical protein